MEDNEFLAQWTPSAKSIKELYGIHIPDPDWPEDTAEFRDVLSDNSYEEGATFKINDSYSITIVEQYGGEGCGDEYWFVFSVDKDGVAESFWKIPGWYQSYHGGEFEFSNVFEVESREVVVKKWFKKTKSE